MECNKVWHKLHVPSELHEEERSIHAVDDDPRISGFSPFQFRTGKVCIRTVEPSDFDHVSRMMDLSFYRQRSAIQDWMEHGRSNAPPTLDEDSDISDVPLPNPMFTSLAEDNENLEQWAGENVGDTHLGKRKTKVLRPGPLEKKGKMIRSPQEEELASNATTLEPSGGGDEGNTDNDDDDDDDIDNDDGGSGYPVSSQAGGRSARSMPVLCTLVSMHYEVCMNYALFCFCEL